MRIRKGKDRQSDGKVQRISVSLPEDVFYRLDQLVDDRGYENRSKAIAEMIINAAIERPEYNDERVMTGTITLVYDESKGNLLHKLAELERRYIDEVISSHHIQLENNYRMEVLLVQGPGMKLKRIADALTACQGVRIGKLTLSSMIIPPLHPLPDRAK